MNKQFATESNMLFGLLVNNEKRHTAIESVGSTAHSPVYIWFTKYTEFSSIMKANV
jgi:hypothetical protein